MRDLGSELVAAVQVATERDICDPDTWTRTRDEDCRRAAVAVVSALAEHIDESIGWRQLYDLADEMERDAAGLPGGGS